MTRKKDSRRSRHKDMLEFVAERRQKQLPGGKKLTFIGMGDLPPRGNPVDNPHPWDLCARMALRLDGDGTIASAVRTAFRELGLDPVDPYDWRLLVEIYSYIEFGKRPRRKPGKEKWKESSLRRLLAVRREIGGSDREAVRRVARMPEFALPGLRTGRHGLRKALARARKLPT